MEDRSDEPHERWRVREVGREDQLDLKHTAVPKGLCRAEDGGDPHTGVRVLGADARPVDAIAPQPLLLLPQVVHAAVHRRVPALLHQLRLRRAPRAPLLHLLHQLGVERRQTRAQHTPLEGARDPIRGALEGHPLEVALLPRRVTLAQTVDLGEVEMEVHEEQLLAGVRERGAHPVGRSRSSLEGILHHVANRHTQCFMGYLLVVPQHIA
mmetsp:Transcript_6841/g.17120  ORF Transcript_6841/g.17120 Transcript_6841/m.17120 type:complete len:210 (+) Transcript_6841:715-1344(+)